LASAWPCGSCSIMPFISHRGDPLVYSKFGSALTLINKQEDSAGQLLIFATAAGGTDVREYRLADLKADDGSAEIDQATKNLPWKPQPKPPERTRRELR